MKKRNHNKNHKRNRTHEKRFNLLTLSFTLQHKNNHFIIFFFLFSLFLFLLTKIMHNLQEFFDVILKKILTKKTKFKKENEEKKS